jgi:hypothetical protein
MLLIRYSTTRHDASYSKLMGTESSRTLTVTSGLQPRAVQGMLDFDFICKRTTPSVAGIIYTFGGQFVSKMQVLESFRACYESL